MSSHFVIAGFPSNTQVRLEINDLVRDEKQFSLYIQALRRMYDDTQGNIQSFFQVGGIHGLPFTAWDGAVGNGPVDPNAQWGGYCTHGSALFPTWHRPYVMLLEQILNRYAQEIAGTYTVDQDEWREAAENLRQPYWDWARNTVPPPEVISLQRVTIIASNGQRVQVDNPLLRYRFHPIDESFPPPYNRWVATLRHPNTTGSNATDDVNRMRRVLQNAQRGITTATYSMLTRVRSWEAFSSHTVGDGGSASNSVEAIHDNIHVLVGGNGHMADPAVAAFDPIFFLHHCNVDRLLSLWSAINPGVWITTGDAQDGSFTLSVEQPVDADTPLTPFWNQQTSFWTSSDLQDMDFLGYTYPEFVGLDMSNTSAVRTAILRAVNALYGPSARSLASVPVSLAVKPEGTQESVQRVSQAAFSLPAGDKPSNVNTSRSINPPDDSAPAVQGNADGVNDWIARIRFKKYELGTSFSVLLFLGEVPEDPKEWLVSENLVGAHHAFVNSSAERCANCRDRLNIVEEGFINLNDGIAAHSNLGSYEPRVVEPYLTRELKWRVQKVDCTPVELSSLEVSVLDVLLTSPPGSEIPVPGQPRYHTGITHDQSGGARNP